MILLNVHQLTKSFAGKTLFKNISFGVKEGEKIGLVGANGAGKSTLLRILNHQMVPDSGSVVYRSGVRISYLEQDPQFDESDLLFNTIAGDSPDGDQLERALILISRLGLTQFESDFKVKSMSGGWQKRVALARALMADPQLLMLDEPTNHLDIEGVLWLEEFVSQSQIAVLSITHDRLFLQRTANKIFDLDPQNPKGLVTIDGGYLAYLDYKQDHTLALESRHEKLKNTLRRETEWLRRGSIARQTKQQARKDQAHELKIEVEDIAALTKRRKLGIEFDEADRTPKQLIRLEGVGKEFGGRWLFRNLNLVIQRHSRIGLLGQNGSGKSTLIRLLVGLDQPSVGSVRRTDEIQINYFEQSKESLNPDLTVRQSLAGDGDYVHFNGQYVHVGSYLDRFLFGGTKAFLPVHRLSGGERARLRIAQLMLKPAQLLILDEPTNDLDSQTMDVLEEALSEFRGAIVLVTHDRYFLDSVADQILAFPDADSSGGEIVSFADYFQWESWRKAVGTQRQRSSVAHAAGGAVVQRKLSFKEKRELEQMEAEILKSESALSDLTRLLEDPLVLKDGKRLFEIQQQIAESEKQIARHYERWAELDAIQKKGSV